MMKNGSLSNPWNDLARKGYKRVPDTNRPWYRYSKRLLSQLDPKPGSKALDVGCGVGEFLAVLNDAGFEASGVDGSSTQVAHVVEGGMAARVVDLEGTLPFNDSSFSLVTCLEVIEHIARAEVLLREVRRVLSPSGKLLITTPNFAFLNNRIHYLLGSGPCSEGVHLRFFTKDRLEDLLRDAGFGVAGRASYGVVPAVSTVLTRAMHRPPLLWKVPEPLESLFAYDLIYLAAKVS
jgi:methionine biosynthesis protein MetW